MSYPQKVFKHDETSFFKNLKLGNVLAEKRSTKNYIPSESNEKLNLTILLTANTASELALPTIVNKYTRLLQQLVEAMPINWCIKKSEN